MSGTDKPAAGTAGWIDLTVENAEDIRDFYAAVIGWKQEPVSMGEYDDFNMIAPGTGAPAAGICHRRGGNADIPPHWMVYFIVDDLDASVAACTARGGTVLVGPKGEGGRYCIVRDPASAVCALFQPA